MYALPALFMFSLLPVKVTGTCQTTLPLFINLPFLNSFICIYPSDEILPVVDISVVCIHVPFGLVVIGFNTPCASTIFLVGSSYLTFDVQSIMNPS